MNVQCHWKRSAGCRTNGEDQTAFFARGVAQATEALRAAVVEVSSHHQGGETLAGLSGAAATLRYLMG